MSGVDVAAFVLARLAEDEQVARAAQQELERWGGSWESFADDIWKRTAAFDAEAVAVHIARHDPARVLADVAAKRAIVERFLLRDREFDHNDRISMALAAAAHEAVVLLAQPYADHEDFDPAWAVAT